MVAGLDTGAASCDQQPLNPQEAARCREITRQRCIPGLRRAISFYCIHLVVPDGPDLISSDRILSRREPRVRRFPLAVLGNYTIVRARVAEEALARSALGDRGAADDCLDIQEMTRLLECSRRPVWEIQDGLQRLPDRPESVVDPLWMSQVSRPEVIHDFGLRHALKFLRREKAQRLIA